MPLSSIFEVFSIGPGPSSTHSIGPQRAAKHFLTLLPAAPARVRVTLFGSLAATGRGHWTDKTLVKSLAPVPAEVVLDTATPADTLPHPNTMRFEAFDASGALLAPSPWTVCSIGGGNLADPTGTPLLSDAAPLTYPLDNITAAMDYCLANDLAFWQIPELHEPDLWTRLDPIWTAMVETIQRGLQSPQIVLPGTLQLPRRAPIIHLRAHSLKGTKRTLALFASYALAVAEENAAGGNVVTAPSCGAAGILPAVLYFYQHEHREPRERILQALATAGLFGASIRANATVSGAEAGCQAEVGSACSMAAAAAAQLEGATIFQIEYAAEMAMEHNLGLTCDPIEGYVQIPCIERNMNAALRAVECATMALLSDGRHLVPFDAVVEVMASTGRDLQAAYRETATGGLAYLWRRELQSRLSR